MVESLEVPLGKNLLVVKYRHVVDSFTFIFLLLSSLILISGYWLVAGVVDEMLMEVSVVIS